MEAANCAPPQPLVEDSLKKRYFYKLGTNLVGFLLSFVTASIAPRALGPAAYGNFGFLSTFSSRIVGFLDSGTSIGFYTKFSQRPQESGLLRFYWGFASVLSLVVLLSVTGVFVTGLESGLWPGQEARYVWMAVVWGLLTWYNGIISKVVDAYGLTVSGEVARVGQRILGASLILLMFWLNRFSLTEFFLYHYLVLLFLCLSWWRILKQEGLSLFPKTRLTWLEFKSYSREFYDYSAPLITYSFVGLLVGVLDRWLLQRLAGSVEQGFYTLSFKIGAICFMFTSAMTPLLTREFSKAHGAQDLTHMRALFQRYVPMLYSIAAFFAVFIAVQAEKVSVILGGDQYQAASLAVAIMAFYPIHQTYGQLSGSVFYATGQTRLYRNLGISTMLLSLPLTFWLLAPEKWWGLNLGATGLAIKMVLLQLVTVNLQLWFNTRLLHLSFWKFLGCQLYTVGLLAGIAWLAMAGVDLIIENVLIAFLVSGFLYALGFVLVSFLFPSVLSMSRAELIGQLVQLRLKLTGNHKGCG